VTGVTIEEACCSTCRHLTAHMNHLVSHMGHADDTLSSTWAREATLAGIWTTVPPRQGVNEGVNEGPGRNEDVSAPRTC
jgi:hypothetical protein